MRSSARPTALERGRYRAAGPDRPAPLLDGPAGREAAGFPPPSGRRPLPAPADGPSRGAAGRGAGGALRRPGRRIRRHEDPPRRSALDGGRLRGLPRARRSAPRLLRVGGRPARDAVRRADRVSPARAADDLRGRGVGMPWLPGPRPTRTGTMVRVALDPSRADGGRRPSPAAVEGEL